MTKFLFRLAVASVVCLLSLSDANAQLRLGVGTTYGFDIYQRYTNPKTLDETEERSSGCAMNSLFLGPVVWLGSEKFSVSFEASANWGALALDLQEYKGLGAFAFPLVGRLNFGGLSNLGESDGFGFSLGAGVQYSKTEFYGLTKQFKDNTTRQFFRTIFLELAIGSGDEDSTGSFFVRYGKGDNQAASLNIGAGVNLNFLHD
ncbi:MAG: hypothetical protein AAB316_13680 [Bacteroidota bacterium]